MVSSTVRPCDVSPRTTSHACRRAAGSKPVVGSSRKIRSGWPITATARSSRRRWPPLSFPARRSAASDSPTRLQRLRGRHRPRVQRRAERQHLPRRQQLLRRRVLERDADARAVREAAAPRVHAQDLHIALVAMAEALQDLDGRRLARAVGAQQRVDLPRLDRQIDAVGRADRAVALDQAAHRDRRGRRRHGPDHTRAPGQRERPRGDRGGVGSHCIAPGGADQSVCQTP